MNICYIIKERIWSGDICYFNRKDKSLYKEINYGTYQINIKEWFHLLH